jgi:predicted acyl esterase
VVLTRSPYGRGGAAFLFAAPLARQGFQVFMQSTRGTFGSGGQFRPFLPNGRTGWPPWPGSGASRGATARVAMTGASYLGHTQWAVAPYADPPLRSVALNVTTAKFTEAFYHHGAPSLQNTLNWIGLVGRQERGLPGVIPNPRQVGQDEAGPAEGPAAGRRRRGRGRAGRFLAGFHRARRPGRPVLGRRRS